MKARAGRDGLATGPASGGPAEGRLEQALRFIGAEGSLAALLLCCLVVVAWSLERADWTPTPSLPMVAAAAVLTGLFVYRAPLPGVTKHLTGALLGFALVSWQTLTLVPVDGVRPRVEELLSRLGLWVRAATQGGISSDMLPFALMLVLFTWLAAYVSALMLFRYRSYWATVVIGGIALLFNLASLPDSYLFFFLLYMLAAMVLRVRLDTLDHQGRWRTGGVAFPGRLGLFSLRNGAIFAVAVIGVAYFLPVGPASERLNRVYEEMRSPGQDMGDDFSRLFAGLPARKPTPYRTFGEVMALQGAIFPSNGTALIVEAPFAMYWRARTYSTYTSKGWVSDGLKLHPAGWTPTYTVPEDYVQRRSVTYAVRPAFSTPARFGSGEIQGFDQTVLVEAYDSPVYTLTFPEQSPASLESLPGTMRALRQKLQTAQPATEGDARELLPRDLVPLDVKFKDGVLSQVQVARMLPAGGDVASYRAAKGVPPTAAYQVTASVSLASPAELRSAGRDYPGWVLDRYLQLPPTLTERVRTLAARITQRAVTPYDKALAIQRYLAGLGYNEQVTPAPYNLDGVDHFLFTLRQGYCDYFASAMVVMARSVGIPARIAGGYTPGVRTDEGFVVTDAEAHSWPQLFFPDYGWIDFEPTPGRAIPEPDFIEEPDVAVGAGGGENIMEEDLEDELLAGVGGGPGIVRPWSFASLAPWLAVLGVLAVAGGYGWKRTMSVPEGPLGAYAQMCLLGRLAGTGPLRSQTAYEYAQVLGERLPAGRDQAWTIARSYVAERYGRSLPSPRQRANAATAWRGLRFHLLRLVLRLPAVDLTLPSPRAERDRG